MATQCENHIFAPRTFNIYSSSTKYLTNLTVEDKGQKVQLDVLATVTLKIDKVRNMDFIHWLSNAFGMFGAVSFQSYLQSNIIWQQISCLWSNMNHSDLD
jgi:hypothetical protein